jgi:hypothetical protein
MKPAHALPMLLLAGCVPVDGKSPLSGFFPTVSFTRLDVNGIDFEQVSTDFVFTVDNPNPVGFAIDHFDYGLAFSGIEWASGDNPDGLAINPDVGSEVALPVDIVFEELFDMVEASRGLDHLPFGLDGNFGIRLESDTLILSESETEASAAGVASVEEDGEGYVLDLPYSADGDFPALRRPGLSFRKLKIRDYSLSSVDMALKFDVDNDHASELVFTRFDYDLSLGGSQVISGVVDGLNQVISGASEDGEESRAGTVLVVPIEIDLAEAGAGLLDAVLGSSRMNIGFEAAADVETPFGIAVLSIDEQGEIDVEMD